MSMYCAQLQRSARMVSNKATMPARTPLAVLHKCLRAPRIDFENHSIAWLNYPDEWGRCQTLTGR